MTSARSSVVLRTAAIISVVVVTATVTFCYFLIGSGAAVAGGILALILGAMNVVITPRLYRRWWGWVDVALRPPRRP
jgi:hypothetical protein